MKKLNFIYSALFFVLLSVFLNASTTPPIQNFSWGEKECGDLQLGLYFQGQQARYGDQIPFWVAVKNLSNIEKSMTLFYDLDSEERVLLHVRSLERAYQKNFPGIRPHLPSKHGYSIEISLKPNEVFMHPGFFFFLGPKFTGKNEAYVSFKAGDFPPCLLKSPKIPLKIKA
jgi:hypothetical protein